MKYTHKGWFFLCPVYLSPDEVEMPVEARFAWLEWWFSVQEFIFGLMCYFMTAIDPTYEPMFPFRVTGELNHE